MQMTRRDLVSACAAASFVPAAACRAAVVPQLKPESFGAVGNGIADDYAAFQRLAAAANAAGGASITLASGSTYYLGRYVAQGNGVNDVVFQGCSRLSIEGNGATISTKGDFARDQKTTRGLTGLRFEDCTDVQVRNLHLVGNVQRTTRPASMYEAPTHGLVFGGCSDVIVDKVIARHFAADGLYIRESTKAAMLGTYRASRRFAVRNSQFLFNARQGCSVIQLRDAVFENCDFSYTGYVAMPAVVGPYGHHAPAAGVDVEPNYAPFSTHAVDVLTGNIAFRRCRMVGNFGATISAAMFVDHSAVIENVTLEECTLETNPASNSRYGFIFDVRGGSVTRSTLTMHDKTAYIGWFKDNDASPTFSGNTVSGSGGPGGAPMLTVRPTAGAPVVEGNRFVLGRGGAAKTLVQIANPKAVVRNNVTVSGG